MTFLTFRFFGAAAGITTSNKSLPAKHSIVFACSVSDPLDTALRQPLRELADTARLHRAHPAGNAARQKWYHVRNPILPSGAAYPRC
jgi:hypothetical protein